MVKRYNRLLVAFHVVSDAMLAALAFVLAYVLRFESGLPVPKGYPPFERYIKVLPLVACLVVFAYYLQSLYRLRRGVRGSTISSPFSSAPSSPSCWACGRRSTSRPTTSATR